MRRIFTELGFDADHHKYLFGISSEIEEEDGTEIRKVGFLKMKLTGCYLRVWIGKMVFGIGIPSGLLVVRKQRYNFKVVLGFSGNSLS